PGRARRRFPHRGAHIRRALRRGRGARRIHDHQPRAGGPPGRYARARGRLSLRPRRATAGHQRRPNGPCGGQTGLNAPLPGTLGSAAPGPAAGEWGQACDRHHLIRVMPAEGTRMGGLLSARPAGTCETGHRPGSSWRGVPPVEKEDGVAGDDMTAESAEPVVELLDEAECQGLIAAGGVGRIGYTGRFGPTILPVNYVLHEGTIVFRTGQHSPLGEDLRTGIEHAESKVAFEIDEASAATREGWSVLVQGSAHLV